MNKTVEMVKSITLDYFEKTSIPANALKAFAKSKDNFSMVARRLCLNVNDDTFEGYKQAVNEYFEEEL